MNTFEKVNDICRKAKIASASLAAQNTKKKNEILTEISNSLISHTNEIIAANKLDLENAEANGVPSHMLDRLMLNASSMGKPVYEKYGFKEIANEMVLFL